MAQGRGRLNLIEQLPGECAEIVAWAAGELQKRERTQTDIYSEFVSQLEGLKAERRGELEFDIPSFSSFNRHSIKLATLTQRLHQTREIAATLAKSWDIDASDNLTLIAAEAIKTLVFEVLTSEGEAGIDPKGAMSLANALRAAAQAQGISTSRRQKIEAEFAENAKQAVSQVAKSKGLTAETTQEILSKILGVKAE
ncbi:phage protein Gp27 family protein [Rhizobium sp. BK377]|uniref:phage protein Gp27 family protein n=1 Tax=Rhizobium sp. BK377 TaxID=2587058 RepID=UPI0016148DD2|nr:phage protein Gp27 family protein [Rhizobium sp. BK377]MBB3461993.1 hypothetical protein [Rhizobium sp. BK377]